MIQEITEELQAIEEESSKEDQDSDATQEGDLEQEDSDNTLTESEKQETSICDNQLSNKIKVHNKDNISETKMSEQDINHMEEVIIGTEQGTTFPTKIGTSMCNALIDTSAIKSCISERYYQQLPIKKYNA